MESNKGFFRGSGTRWVSWRNDASKGLQVFWYEFFQLKIAASASRFTWPKREEGPQHEQ